MRRKASKKTGFPGAEKKLRQAEFFLKHLEHASHEMVNEVARGSEYPERLEFFFSACLTAARSARYVLATSYGKKFKDVEPNWENSLSTDSRVRYEWMIHLRDDDVHFAATVAKPEPKYVEQNHRWDQYAAYQPHRHYNAALFGVEGAPVFEFVNPDGKKVSGPVVRGTVGLYLEHHGEFLEATTVCRGFIDHLRSLLDAVKAAP